MHSKCCSLAVLILFFVMAVAVRPAGSGPPTHMRAMWVWSTRTVVTNHAERDRFLRYIVDAKFTDVYLYLRARDYTTLEPALRALLLILRKSGIRAWGMEGWRGYFSDVDGPAALYGAADAMIAFNKRNAVGFVGFHSDVEFPDGQGDGTVRFHNGVAQSKLTAKQSADRDGLLAEWLSMHATLLGKAMATDIIYSAAIPSWVDDYEGEPITAVHQGVRKGLMQHLMAVVQDYVIMSYNTNPANVISRIGGELEYADSLRELRPRILFGLETHAGAGIHVSYADTPSKGTRAAVLADYEAISHRASEHRSFAGGAIHDWEGWRDLR